MLAKYYTFAGVLRMLAKYYTFAGATRRVWEGGVPPHGKQIFEILYIGIASFLHIKCY